MNNKPRQYFASMMRKKMKDTNTTQAELARACGLTEGEISRLCRGVRHPTLASAMAVARVLGIETGDLK